MTSRLEGIVAGAMASKMMVSAIALVLLAGFAAGDPYEEFRSNMELRDTNLEEPGYRLKDTVQPRFIDVDLDVYLDESSFNGLVEIVVDTLEPLRQIVLHQNVVSITAVSVLDSNSQAVPLQFPDAFETDSYYEVLKINFADEIPIGTYTLMITYLGRINENPLDRGFYKGYYFLNGETHYYATTQFQPYHARKAFPCFDEPQFKSRFTISITRPSDFSPSYSNMAINSTQTVATGRVRETFLPTPTVSAYLVAFHVSDFQETTATGTEDKPFGIISRQGSAALSQHEYAAEIGVAITDWMDRYFEYNYYDMGEGQPMKNDHIALPDFPSGAMENWGMVNYREAYLLYDPQNTNLVNKIFIATIMAHELAHKWFGNLVTCFWWSNLWLNESFASYFEYFGAHGADPLLELDDQFVVDYVHSALSGDASSGANPMNWTGVVNNPSITAHFSFTSYAKGASVLKMMEHFVRPETFRKALAAYLRDNAYQLGTPELMYQAFRNAVAEDNSLNANLNNVDVGAVFDSWVQNPGAPVVTVAVDHDTGLMIVSQQRYQLTGTRPNTLWQIPLTWTRAGAINFDDTTPVALLTGTSTILNKPAGHEWVIFNIAQSGYYRVNYDAHNWEMIAEALRNNREEIHKLNRAQIVNDVLFFVRSGDIEIDLAFDVLSFLKDETDYYVWAGALGQLDWLRRRSEHIPQLYEEFSAYLLEQMETVIEALGYDEQEQDTTSVILNRAQILNYACNLGHEGCIADSLAKWQAFRQNPSNLVPVNLRRHVYCIGLREGGQVDYNFLWNRYNSSENTADMVVMLRALACTTNQASVLDYLEQSLYSSTVRIHDRTNAFSFALQGNPENLETVLNFVYQRYAEIRENYGGSARLNIALNSIAAFLTDFSDIVSFQTWLYQNQLNLPDEFSTGLGVVNAAVANLEWSSDNAVDLHSFMIRRNNGAATLMVPLTLILAALFTHLLRQ